MKFLNLDSLKVEDLVIGQKCYNNKCILEGISLDESIQEFNKKIEDSIKAQIKVENEPVLYEFHCECHDEMNDEEEDWLFETVVNVTLLNFFEFITNKEKGRPRERRLAVPEDIGAVCNINVGLLKNAINYSTSVNRFNVKITMNGNKWCYEMINAEEQEG